MARWRRVVEFERGLRLEPLRIEHASLMARLLDDPSGAHWTGMACPDPADPVPWVISRLGKTPACYVVCRGGEALGYAQLRLEGNLGSPALWLATPWRQRGLGSAVIRCVAALGERAGLGALVTGIRQGNVASRATFEQCGWLETDWRVDAPFADCGIWALSLGGAGSRCALNLAAQRFYRASTPLLGLHQRLATPCR